MVAESDDFQELDFLFVKKILSSNELNVDSELEIFSAVKLWVMHNVKDRSKYSTDLLSTVRFKLLSDHALNYILKESSCFCSSGVCNDIIKHALVDNSQLNPEKSSSKARQCNQNNFDVVVCGSVNKSWKRYDKGLYFVEPNSMETTRKDNLQSKDRIRAENLFCIRGEIYALSSYYSNYKLVISVDKYVQTTSEWKKLADMNKNRIFYCTCSFMGEIFTMAGIFVNSTNSCVKFNVKDKIWVEIANLIEGREYAACAVYKGRIVVSGGHSGRDSVSLNTVEAYDHVADAWTPMTSMVEARSYHKTVAFRNKLFVLGGNSATMEVFDSDKFALLKPSTETLLNNFYLRRPTGAFLIEDKIFVFKNERKSVLVYDVIEGKWMLKSCQITRNLEGLCCVKFPKLEVSTF